MADLVVYLGLFSVAFAAATILPAQSEAALAALLLTGGYSSAGLVAVASIGNTLGAAVNWLFGRGLERFHDKPWFPASASALDRASRWYGRYGRWSLLLSWVPIVGDPLTVVAGVLREPFWSFLALVGIAKTLRYIVLAMVTLGWM